MRSTQKQCVHKINCSFPSLFLLFRHDHAIIINNAVKRCDGLNSGSYACQPCQSMTGLLYFTVPERGSTMAVSYKKLWKLLIDRDMKKRELCELAGISQASITKMKNGGNVTTDILVKICAALDCRIEEIMEIE